MLSYVCCFLIAFHSKWHLLGWHNSATLHSVASLHFYCPPQSASESSLPLSSGFALSLGKLVKDLWPGQHVVLSM